MPKQGKQLPAPEEIECKSPYQIETKYCCREHAHLEKVKQMRAWRIRVRDEANERWLQEA